MTKRNLDFVEEGAKSYQRWRDELLSNPEARAIYEEEAAKGELWLKLVEARKSMGLTQTQMATRLGVSRGHVSRIENSGYVYSIKTLRRYIQMLEATTQDTSSTHE